MAHPQPGVEGALLQRAALKTWAVVAAFGIALAGTALRGSRTKPDPGAAIQFSRMSWPNSIFVAVSWDVMHCDKDSFALSEWLQDFTQLSRMFSSCRCSSEWTRLSETSRRRRVAPLVASPTEPVLLP